MPSVHVCVDSHSHRHLEWQGVGGWVGRCHRVIVDCLPAERLVTRDKGGGTKKTKKERKNKKQKKEGVIDILGGALNLSMARPMSG